MTPKQIIKRLILATCQGKIVWNSNSDRLYTTIVGDTEITLITDLKVQTGPYALEINTPGGTEIIQPELATTKTRKLLARLAVLVERFVHTWTESYMHKDIANL